MSHLRADLHRPWGLSLARQLSRAFGKFHEFHADGLVPFYLMSVIADNDPARRLLTSGIPGLPHAREYARMYTYAVSPRRVKAEIPLPNGMQLQGGTPSLVGGIMDCLQRNLVKRQFSPAWTSSDLFVRCTILNGDLRSVNQSHLTGFSATDWCDAPSTTPNLHPEDFIVVVKGSRVAGCLAIWDQTPFKQTMVRGYSGWMARGRPLINLLARFIDLPQLPPVGASLPYCFVSHLAVDDDEPHVFASLLRAAYNATHRRGFNYFMIGLAETNPLRPVLTKNYLHITYPSQIYLMAWDDGLDDVAQVDGRVPGLEIAVL